MVSVHSFYKNKELIESTLEIVRSAGLPVSVDYVANHLGLTWQSTRAILMQLSLEGMLSAVKTTKSWIFQPTEGVCKKLRRERIDQ